MNMLLCGDRYCSDMMVKMELQSLEAPEFNFIQGDTWNDEVSNFCNSIPLIGTRKIAYIKMKEFKAGSADLKLMADYLKNPSEHASVFLYTEKVDARSEVFKLLDKQKCVRSFDKYTEDKVYDFVRKRLNKVYGFDISQIDALKEVFEERLIGYQLDEKYDLYLVKKNTDMLGCSGTLSRDMIEFYFPETLAKTSFDLAKLLFEGKTEDMVVLAKKLIVEQKSDTISLLSLVLSTVRICYKASIYSYKKRSDIVKQLGIKSIQLNNAYQCYSRSVFAEVYAILQNAVNQIKKGEDSLAATVLSLVQASNVLKEASVR